MTSIVQYLVEKFILSVVRHLGKHRSRYALHS